MILQILPAGIVTALKAADRIGFDVPLFGTWTAAVADFFKLGHGLIRDRLAMSFWVPCLSITHPASAHGGALQKI